MFDLSTKVVAGENILEEFTFLLTTSGNVELKTAFQRCSTLVKPITKRAAGGRRWAI